jgi:Ca2+-binding EF-hand superfamily protein
MNKFLAAGAATGALLFGTAAIGQAAKPAPVTPGSHRSMQPETRAQMQARVQAIFARLDANRDGFITKDELNALEAQRAQKMEQRAERFDPSKMFDRLDLNHDGKITVAEAQAAHSQHAQAKGGEPVKAQATGFSGLFARADANKDGVVTRDEFNAMGQQIKARMEKASVARGSMATRMFDRADANHDGRVSLQEMQNVALTQFDRIDTNHDGTISPQERQQARALFKAQHHQS